MKHVLASFQWMLFILMGSIVVPVAIASSFGFNPESLVAFVSRTLFVLGIAGLLQVLFGHKLPITEGPAGVWWGVFTLYLGVGAVMFGSNDETLKVLEFCFILSGLIFIALAYLGVVEKIAKIFTPTIMGTYLVLMVIQLSGTFVKGMAGIKGNSAIDMVVLTLSIITVAVAYISMRFNSVKKYAVLVSIVVGWLLFIVFGKAEPVLQSETYIELPKIFAFGTPRIEINMIANVFLLTILLLTNLMASVRAVQIVFENFEIKTENRLKQTSVISGLIHVLAGVFGSIGPVPISGSAAFISMTRITSKIPFIIGNLLIIFVSLSPKITAYFAALPPAVGYAALVPTFGFGTIVIAKNQLALAKYADIRNFVAATAWFIGMGIMFLPSSAFDGLPIIVVSLLSNGLVVGTAVAVVMELLMTRRRERELATENA